jgi:hypothetical protein
VQRDDSGVLDILRCAKVVHRRSEKLAHATNTCKFKVVDILSLETLRIGSELAANCYTGLFWLASDVPCLPTLQSKFKSSRPLQWAKGGQLSRRILKGG